MLLYSAKESQVFLQLLLLQPLYTLNSKTIQQNDQNWENPSISY